MPTYLEERQMLSELLKDDSDVMDDWDTGFIDSLRKWTGHLTDKQSVALEKLWDKVFG